jgi:hypothetical protein
MNRIGDICESNPIYHCCDVWRNVRPRAGPLRVIFGDTAIVKASRGRDHRGGKRKVSAGGSARNHYLADVKVVLRCVTSDPVQRATTDLNRCRSERNFRYAVLNIHCGPPHFQIRQE